MMQQQRKFNFLREAQVASLTGLSKSTRWRLEKDGKFPKKRQLAAKSVGWLAAEIEEWMQTRTTIKTGDITDKADESEGCLQIKNTNNTIS